MPKFSTYRFCVYGGEAASGDQPDQALEVRLQHFSRQISGSPFVGPAHVILDGNTLTPAPAAKIVFPLPLHDVDKDPVLFHIYVVQLLSSLHISAAACGKIAEKIASYVAETAGEDRERKLQIVAEVDEVELSWRGEEGVEEGTARQGNGEELGDCSICLEELSYRVEKKEEEAIEAPCGHVFHEFCIFKWFLHNNSCPLCRCPLLPLQD